MSGFSLYQISHDYLSALDALTSDDAMPEEAIADTMEGIQGAWEDKAANVARYIKNLEVEVKARKEAAKAMSDLAASAQSKADKLRRYLLEEVKRTGLNVDQPDVVVKTVQNPKSVEVTDESLLGNRFFISKTERLLSKTLIRVALEAGEDVAGARLVNGVRLVIK